MQAHDLDAPNLDTVLNRMADRVFSWKTIRPTSMPSVTEWASRASAVFLFLFLIVAGVGIALAWRLTDKPTAPPEGFAELQQQVKSIASDLVAVRNTLDQQSVAVRNTLDQSAANRDQLTRIQEQISQQSIALLSAASLADKPVRTPLPKPAQQPVQVSTQDSSKPIQRAPPLPPKQ